MHLDVPFLLASASPRRQQLLERIGFTFEVIPSDVEERVPHGKAPSYVVQHLAELKAETVAGPRPEALTLGADTVVVLEEEILGKPADEEEARLMLRRLSGRTHTVLTGLALLHPASGRRMTAYESTRVTFAELEDAEIEAYVRTGSPLDKAGAYGIQDDRGALYVTRIDGDYYNVVGLPLHRLYTLLRKEFGDLFSLADRT